MKHNYGKDRSRNIVSEYMEGRKSVKITRAHHSNTAISTAVRHMEFDDYSANKCQIYNAQTGRMLGEVKRSPQGDIKVQFFSRQ